MSKKNKHDIEEEEILKDKLEKKNEPEDSAYNNANDDGEEDEEDDLDDEDDANDEEENDDADEENDDADEENDGEEDENDDADNSEHDRKNRKKTLMHSLLNDGDSDATNLKELLKSIEFNGEWFRKNIKLIMVLTGCVLVCITNRYQAQQEMIEEAKLKRELADMKYIWLTRFSELTTSTRQSQIEEQLKQNGDSTLAPSKDAPFIIRVQE